MTRLFWWIAYLMMLFAMVGACAHVKAVETACAPATAQVAGDVLAILDDPTLSNAEAVAKLEASGVAFCVITALAKDAIHAATGVQFATSAPSPRVVHSQAWVAKHP
jgi:hypothetical protein